MLPSQNVFKMSTVSTNTCREKFKKKLSSTVTFLFTQHLYYVFISSGKLHFKMTSLLRLRYGDDTGFNATAVVS